MTYEDLFICIDEAAPKLPGCALRLLLRLISMALKSGSNEIRISIRTLATEMDMTKDAVTVATLALKGIITTKASPGVPCTFTLPADWFAPQRSLFAVSGNLDNRLQRPGNQDTDVLETRTLAYVKPGHSVLETRTPWATYQDGVSRKPGHLGDFPGHSVLETRTVNTQNQQDADGSRSDQSDLRSSSPPDSVTLINQICHHTTIPVGREKDAEVLREHLSEYMKVFGSSHTPPPGPHVATLSRCLAIAPLETLLMRLRSMSEKNPGKPREWIWFLILFAQDLLGIEKEITVEAIRRFNRRKPPTSQMQPNFPADLLQQTAAGMRRLH